MTFYELPNKLEHCIFFSNFKQNQMWLVTYLFLKHHGISIWGPYENVKWLRGGGLSFWKRARGALGGNRGLTLEHQLWSLPQQDLGDMIFENLILCITIIIDFFIKQSLSKIGSYLWWANIICISAMLIGIAGGTSSNGDETSTFQDGYGPRSHLINFIQPLSPSNKWWWPCSQ